MCSKEFGYCLVVIVVLGRIDWDDTMVLLASEAIGVTVIALYCMERDLRDPSEALAGI